MRAAPGHARSLAVALLAGALAVRLFGLNYDQSHYYHPDERRIAEAVTQLSFRPLQLDPHFFAYGSFPFYVTKAVTSVLSVGNRWFSSYDSAVLTGRALSALWGTATVALLMLLARRLFGGRTALLAGALLGATVLHVQNSHFATTDVPLTFLVLLALALMVRAAGDGGAAAFAGAGSAIGFAVATKFSALPLLLPLAVTAALVWRRDRRPGRAAAWLALGCACAGAAFALGEPYALLNHRAWLHDILEQSAMVRNAGALPYTNQYVGVPKVVYDLREMVVWGMGPLLGIAALAGVWRRVRPKAGPLAAADWILLAWVVPFFAVTCSFDVKFVRYLLPIYPPLVMWGAAWLQEWSEAARAGRWARGAVAAGTALYLLAFLSIYARPHAAVSASAWFYGHARAGDKVLTQDWDEGFPFALPGRSPERFKVVQFGFYEADSPAKARRLAQELASSDWVVLQTKRLYGAITRVPTKYPLTDNFFHELFAGDLGYTLVKDVASRPELLGVELPTELADESFSVYDHPKALVFRNTGRLDTGALETRIRNSLPSRPVSRASMLLARAGSEPPPGGAPVVRSSLLATLLCAALLEALALAAWALLRVALPARPGIYALSKVAGVLVFAYVPWLTTSLGVTRFARPALAWTAIAIGAAAWLLSRSRREPWPERRELVASEAVFWGAFALFLGLRLLNPEVFWGEKPMDFSFLNTLYRSEALPPPEPWFAGSPLKYTYFGHYTVAAVGKLLAINPAVMFNLAVAMTAGLTAAALFAAGALVGGGWRVGTVAAAATLLLGNLSGVRELAARHAVNFDYFWATSRVIKDTINEYPFWSFSFADLHAHVLVMPWAMAFVALLALWIGRRSEPTPARPRITTATLVALGALTLGAITATNGWSMPTYFALLVGLLAADWLVHRARGGPVRVLRTALSSVAAPAAAMIGGALVAFRPFWQHFSVPARQWGREVGPYARPADLLTIFGLFLVVLLPFLAETWRRVAAPDGAPLPRATRVAGAVAAAGVLLTLLDLRALAHLALRQATSVAAFAVALALVSALLALHRRTPEPRRLALVLAAFSWALIAGCEFVFVWDRMNTVFKFYLEAWFLLSIASSVVLWELFRPGGARGGARTAWRAAAAAVAAVAAFTSLSGAWGLVTHRHAEGPRFTLDGMAYLARTDPQELAAFEWLNRNVRGLPVLAEAYGPSYGEYTRVCMNTGLPVVLGWDYHVFQRGQRRDAIERRKTDLETIFTSKSRERVAAVLARDRVALVYVGSLERRTYSGANLANFRSWNELLTPLYRNPAVEIFAVNGSFVGAPPGVTVDAAPEPAAVAPRPAEEPQDPPGVLRQPRGLARDAQGNVYVADFGNCRIQKFDRDLKPTATWGRRGAAVGEFQDPCDVAVAPDGSVVVADTWNERIQVFDASGAPLREWEGGFFGPRGVAVDRAGRVWVSDTGNNRLVRFAPDGTRELVVAPAAPPGKLAGPGGIALDAGGRVWVCDNDNARLAVFGAEGAFERSIPVPGWRREAYSEPHVAIDPEGRVWVTVPLASELRAYAPDGALLRAIPAGGETRRPAGLALAPGAARLLVSDIADGVLQLPWPAGIPP